MDPRFFLNNPKPITFEPGKELSLTQIQRIVEKYKDNPLVTTMIFKETGINEESVQCLTKLRNLTTINLPTKNPQEKDH